MPHLTVSHLTVSYGRTCAVDDVSWSLGPGFHVLLGPNGAGKTSLLTALATLVRPTKGTIALDGREGKDIRSFLGYCPQDNLGKSSFTVAQHLEYMCWLRKIPSADTKGEVARILSIIDLEDRAGQRIRALSGGMRRRVAIGSALVGDPALVVLDEPSAGLDIGQREALTRILGAVAGHAITIVSTHLVEDIIDHAQTITVMNSGRFVFDGSCEDFSDTRSLDAVRRTYLRLVA